LPRAGSWLEVDTAPASNEQFRRLALTGATLDRVSEGLTVIIVEIDRLQGLAREPVRKADFEALVATISAQGVTNTATRIVEWLLDDLGQHTGLVTSPVGNGSPCCIPHGITGENRAAATATTNGAATVFVQGRWGLDDCNFLTRLEVGHVKGKARLSAALRKAGFVYKIPAAIRGRGIRFRRDFVVGNFVVY